MRYFLGAAVGLMMATSAYATDPCDHYVVVGGFKSHQAALGRATLVRDSFDGQPGGRTAEEGMRPGPCLRADRFRHNALVPGNHS
jgi:hypothetical protein